jgi:hypothetical protein
MSDSENKQEKKKVSPEFVSNVKKYLEVDDKIRELREQNKKLIQEKKQKEEFILNYLQQVDEKMIDVPDGKLRRNVSKTQAPLKKETIHKALTDIMGDATKALDITDKIIKSRPTVERVTLKRTKHRAKDDVEV